MVMVKFSKGIDWTPTDIFFKYSQMAVYPLSPRPVKTKTTWNQKGVRP